jgi:hypothetical protein
MSFSGGGGATITAHKHTNAAGEGGSLDNTTLLNNISLMGSVVALG